MYSGKSGSIRAKVIVILQNWFFLGKSGCIRAKVVVVVKSGCIWAKVVVFGQK